MACQGLCVIIVFYCGNNLCDLWSLWNNTVSQKAVWNNCSYAVWSTGTSSQEKATLRIKASNRSNVRCSLLSLLFLTWEKKKKKAHPLFWAVLTKNWLLKYMGLFSKSSYADVDNFVKNKCNYHRPYKFAIISRKKTKHRHI